MSDFETWWQQEGQEFLYALNTTTDDDIKLVAEIAWKNGAYCAEQEKQAEIPEWVDVDDYEEQAEQEPSKQFHEWAIAEHEKLKQACQEFTAEQQDRFATAFDEVFAKAGLPQKQAEQPDTPNVDCACGDLYPADSFGAGFIAATGHCQNCDAAEQALQKLSDFHQSIEQKPVAWGYFDADGLFMDALDRQHGAYQTPLYAAPQPDMNLNCKSVQKRLATSWGYVKAEKEEQEPVAVVEITYGREPECYVTGSIDDFPEGVFKLYAAPVRTKYLTDDEISDAIHGKGSPLRLHDYAIRDFRAVIAADREKNK